MDDAKVRGIPRVAYASDHPGALKLLGYWMKDLRESYCLPQELVGELPKGIRERVIEYLRAGTVACEFRGFSWCRFFCNCDRRVMGTRELTDGEWIWPEGLVHYVETHGIVLPEDFIEHVLGQEAPPPNARLEVDPYFGMPLVRSDYWIAWCAQHRSAEWQERIRKARLDCEKIAACALRSSIDARIARFGLADYNCGIPGCGEKARNGLKYCGEHCLLDSECEEITRDCYPISAAVSPKELTNRGGISEFGE